MKVISVDTRKKSKKQENLALNELSMENWFQKLWLILRMQTRWNPLVLGRMMDMIKSLIAIFTARGTITPVDVKIFNRVMTKWFDKDETYTTDRVE